MELTSAEQDLTEQDLTEQDRAEETARLRQEVQQLRYALDHRPQTDRVVGMIMLAASCDADAAWAALSTLSQHTNRKVADLAALISAQVAAGQGLSADLTAALGDARRLAGAAQQRALIRRVHSAPH